MSRRIALLLPLALLAGGCTAAGTGGVNTKNYTGASKAVATTLNDLADAGRKKDGGRVCSQLLSSRRVDQLDRTGGCRKALDDQLDDSDVFDMDVDAIRVRGNRATARVRSNFDGHKQPRTLGLVLEQNRWRLDSISR